VYKEITKAKYEIICDCCNAKIENKDLVGLSIETFVNPRIYKTSHFHLGCYEKIYGKLEVI
jgi:hypothetical protein